jgi:cell wall-associated NlpC family hydrolase
MAEPAQPAWWAALRPGAPGAAAAPEALEVETPEQIIRRVAGAYAFPDADLLVATARQESGLDPLAVGDRGQSYGVFQEHSRGRGAGLPVPSRQDVAAATQRAIAEFSAIRQRNPTVDRGTWAALAQRPLDPQAYARSVNARLASQLGAGAPQPAAPQPRVREAVAGPAGVVAAAAPGPAVPEWWASLPQPQPQGATAAARAASSTPTWLAMAESQLGKPYIWGSAGGRTNLSLDAPGYDCSGFVSQIYRNALGVDLPAFTGTAYQATKGVDAGAARPGDLVFWNMGTPDPRRQHVAIYLGDGKVIQSGGAGAGVNVGRVDQMPGAEFRRSPAAAAVLEQTGGRSGVPSGTPVTAPQRPQTLTLQGAQAPAWWAAVAA